MGDIRTRIIIDADTGQASREMGQLGDSAEDVAVRVNEVTDAFGEEGLAGTFQSGIGPLRGFTDELGAAGEQFGRTAAMWTDLGEAGQIYGESLGFTQEQTQKFATGMGAFGLALGAAQAWWDGLNAERERWEQFDEQQVDEMTEAFAEGTDRLVIFQDAMRKAGAEELKLLNSTTTLNQIFAKYGITVEDMSLALEEADGDFSVVSDAMIEAGAGADEAAVATAALESSFDNMGISAELAAADAAVFGFRTAAAAAQAETAIWRTSNAYRRLAADARTAAAASQVLDFYSSYNPQLSSSGSSGAGAGSLTVNLSTAATPRDVDAALSRWGRIDGAR